MKQKIKITKENDGTIHVDDVDVSKGVYGVNKAGKVLYVQTTADGFALGQVCYTESDYNYKNTEDTLSELVFQFSLITFYTLSGLRIVTEKELSVEDLKDGDNVGFITSDDRKGYVTWVRKAGYVPVSITDYNSKAIGNFSTGADTLYNSLQYAIKMCDDKPTDLYRFTTRKELYAWLAE